MPTLNVVFLRQSVECAQATDASTCFFLLACGGGEVHGVTLADLHTLCFFSFISGSQHDKRRSLGSFVPTGTWEVVAMRQVQNACLLVRKKQTVWPWTLTHEISLIMAAAHRKPSLDFYSPHKALHLSTVSNSCRNLKNAVIGNNKQKTQAVSLGVLPRLVGWSFFPWRVFPVLKE